MSDRHGPEHDNFGKLVDRMCPTHRVLLERAGYVHKENISLHGALHSSSIEKQFSPAKHANTR
jgi:hypothetical protein